MLRLLMVPLIMACALVGTVGMIKLINKFSSDRVDRSKSANKREEKKE